MTKQKKKGKGLKIFVIVLAAIVAFMVTINVIPPKKNVENNPFVVAEGELPMIAAHRGGALNNPENTMLAYREAVNTIGVDIIECDLWLTKDGHLVYNHDETVDRTSNVNGDISWEEWNKLDEKDKVEHKISDMTLEELLNLNFGYYFEDKNSGERIYKDKTMEEVRELGLQIVTVDQLFAEFYESHPDLKFIVEIKDAEESMFNQACKILDETLNKYPNYRDQIVIGTFNEEVENKLKEEYPDLMRGASTGTAAKFIITQFLGVNIFDNSNIACLQIPTAFDLKVINLELDKKTLIDRAHRRNIAVQYWTINEADEMRELIELGCDCIMTDDPVLLKQVLDKYKNK